MLVVPDWPGSLYCMLLERKLKEGKIKVLERFRPRLVCPADIVSNTFRGVPKFNFDVLMMNMN